MTDALSEPEIRSELQTILGSKGQAAFQFEIRAETESTNDDATAKGAAGEAEGFVSMTDFQTAGRGRRENRWSSPVGRNLLFSILLRPTVPVKNWSRIPLLIGLAVARGIESAIPEIEDVELKWPNDLMFRGRKLGGILVESQFQQTPFCVAGVGLNVNIEPHEFPADLAQHSASIFQATERVTSRSRLLAHILAEWLAIYPKALENFEPSREEIDRRSFLKNDPIEIRTTTETIHGRATGIGDRGELRVEVDGEIREIHAAERVRKI